MAVAFVIGGLAVHGSGCARGSRNRSPSRWTLGQPYSNRTHPIERTMFTGWTLIAMRGRVSSPSIRGHLAALRTSCETVVYDLRSGKRLHAWLLPTTVVQFSGEGQRLLTQRKTEFTLWDLTRFQAIHRFEEPSASEDKDSAALRAATAGVRLPAALSPMGRLVAISNHRRLFAAGRPEALLVYSDRGALQHALTIPSEAEIQAVHFISERRLMMSQEWLEHNLGTSCHVLWDAAGGQKVLDLPPGETVRVSDDGRVVASARLTTTGQIPERSQVPTGLRIWKVESGTAVQAVESPAPIRDFCLRPDGARVLAALGERLIEWDVASGARVWEVQKTEHPFATVVYSPDGKRRYATIEIPNGVDDDVDRHLRGWDVSTGQSLAIADYAFPATTARNACSCSRKAIGSSTWNRLSSCVTSARARDCRRRRPTVRRSARRPSCRTGGSS